ncbi:MAG: hypothetical protein H6832_09905 [Planctomycetes bacterium]|nr:hypothetical protein [Planctomycetota bacterium]MCB9891848.1 hypothetical protein [Planctomycetota bacterium]MCB9918704.1 hypothetical protein [Planctomycetota bacterium]
MIRIRRVSRSHVAVCALSSVWLAFVAPHRGVETQPAPEHEAATESEAWVPTADALTPFVLAVMDSYPDDGKHAYWWPRGDEGPKGWIGITKDLVYDDKVLYAGDEKGRCFCCGLTFEVFFEACRLLAASERRDFKLGKLDARGVDAFRRAWFGSKRGDACARDALVSYGLGHDIEDPADARPGDFLQFWRASGSGHSAIFLRWIHGLRRDPKTGAMVPYRRGFEYWSTQKSTGGIGVRREFFTDEDDSSPGKSGVTRKETYIARAGSAPKRR